MWSPVPLVLREWDRSQTLIVDAIALGPPEEFTCIARTLALLLPAGTPPRRLVVTPLFWAPDALLAEWRVLGWGQIVAHPRPASILSLQSVRRLRREGNVLIVPCENRTK